jgi:hypothetical protein
MPAARSRAASEREMERRKFIMKKIGFLPAKGSK